MSATAQPCSSDEVIEKYVNFQRAYLKNYEIIVRRWLKEANLTAPTVADFAFRYHDLILDRKDADMVSDLIQAVHWELTAVNSA
jgi:beta-glucosidase/6-phospho-beta-glucosidase/beta-galactosidase